MTLEALGVKKPFHLDEEELANLLGVPHNSNVEVDKYSLTKEQLKQCHYEQSPIAKLELIYKALKFTLAQEIDTFWRNTNRIQPETNLDIDNLQGLCIYLIGQLQQPKLIVDCHIINDFTSEKTKLTTRMLFANILKASLDYYLSMEGTVASKMMNSLRTIKD